MECLSDIKQAFSAVGKKSELDVLATLKDFMVPKKMRGFHIKKAFIIKDSSHLNAIL